MPRNHAFGASLDAPPPGTLAAPELLLPAASAPASARTAFFSSFLGDSMQSQSGVSVTIPHWVRGWWPSFFDAIAQPVEAPQDGQSDQTTPLWTPETMPNPATNPEACGQSEVSSICDPDHVLGAKGIARLQLAARRLQIDHEYPNCGGYEMAVLAVRKVQGGSQHTLGRLARMTMNDWGIGKKACRNGILLAEAVDDRQLYIATGRGAKEHLPDQELKAVIDRMKPLLNQQRYTDATEQSIADIARILEGERLAPSWAARHAPFFTVTAAGCGICGLTQFSLKKWRQQRFERCQRALAQIEMERAEARAERYFITSCAICLESFAATPSKGTRLLKCGHSFHTSCVDAWVDSRGNCPICRERSSDGNPEDVGLVPPSFQDDYIFRIQRARALFPEYISPDLVLQWSSADFTGPLTAPVASAVAAS